MPFEIDAAYVRDTLTDLVRINSVNPILDPRAPGEREAAHYLAERLRGLECEVRFVEPERDRVSVIATRAGARAGEGRSLMLNAHIDTVGVEGMSDPFSGAERDGRIYGRGAFDMKGAMAACLGAVKAVHDAGVRLAGDLIVAGVADEEYSSLGTASVLASTKVDGAIVTEPTQLRVCLAHKGYVWLRVRTLGRAAHGSRFAEGIDANLRMGRVLHELAELERMLRMSEAHPLVGPPSLHAAILKGGSGISTYAAECVLEIERRTIPGETVELVERQIAEILDRLGAADADFRATQETFFAREPFEVAPDATIVRALESAAARTMERRPDRMGDTPWMDAALLSAAGVETVVFGPSGAGAHSADEWVDVASVVKLAEVLAETAVEYCGRA